MLDSPQSPAEGCDMKEEPSEDRTQDEGAPPGFMDRPEVKEAVEWALAQVRDGRGSPGMGPDELKALADEHRGMAPPD